VTVYVPATEFAVAGTDAMPAAFAAVHLGYGTGFLAGLVRFRRRWGDRPGRES